jgi:hypothetical protein
MSEWLTRLILTLLLKHEARLCTRDRLISADLRYLPHTLSPNAWKHKAIVTRLNSESIQRFL